MPSAQIESLIPKSLKQFYFSLYSAPVPADIPQYQPAGAAAL